MTVKDISSSIYFVFMGGVMSCDYDVLDILCRAESLLSEQEYLQMCQRAYLQETSFEQAKEILDEIESLDNIFGIICQ